MKTIVMTDLDYNIKTIAVDEMSTAAAKKAAEMLCPGYAVVAVFDGKMENEVTRPDAHQNIMEVYDRGMTLQGGR